MLSRPAIFHDKLKSKLKETINQCFFHKNGNCRFQYVVIGYKDTYFVLDHSDAPQKHSDAYVIKMLEYLVDNMFVEFGGRIFQQTIGIPMGTNCAPLLADLFLYSYEAEFVQSLLQAGKKHLPQQFNFTFRYMDDVVSLKTQNIVNFPFLSSNIPSAPAYGVYVSQLIRYARAC